MLYDFHAYQNAQKAGSIHATYLVYGKKAHGTNEDEDVEMGSSQSEYDDEDEVSTTTLSIVREENLEDVLSEYEEVTSIHIYSLSPQRQKDLTLLAGLSKSLLEYQTEDYTKAALKYGTITNSQVRRRPRTLKPPVPPSAKPIKVQPAVKPEEVAKAAKSLVKPGTAITAAAPVTNVKQDLPEHPKKPAPVKRGGSGGLAAAFAKAAAMPSKPKPAPKKEENAMALSDDGEADDNDIAPARKPAKTSTNVAQEAEETRKSRKDREAALRKMMEESDDDEEEANEEDADEEMEEALEPEPESEPVQEKEEPAEVVSSTGDGRRRGKRRVMKKKRILDDQGYMGKSMSTMFQCT